MSSKRYDEAIRGKICRAADHESALQRAVEELEKRLPNEIVKEVDDDGERYRWVFCGRSPQVPMDWAVRAGEFFHNIHCCLDYLVHQSILENKRQPTKKTAFPTVSSGCDWDERSARMLEGASREDKQLLRYFQSFTGGLNLDCDVSVLDEIVSLSNQDKHRYPLTLELRWSFNADPLNHLYEIVPGISLEAMSVPDYQQIKSGQVLLDINEDPSKYVDIEECFGVVLFLVTGQERRPLLHFLGECLRYVNELVRVKKLPGYGGIGRLVK